MAGELILGRYKIVRPLGEGGMGKVYLGRQIDNGRDVVVKVMHEHLAAEPRFRQNFIRETRLMASFRHPHAVAFYDAAVDDPRRLFLVMEYVAGIDLQALIERDGPLPALRAGRLLGQLCSVLHAAHERGILHRDLTAANMMLVNAGRPDELLKVMDFGLARGGGGPYIALAKLTGSASSIGGGTPDYVCPEQIRGEEVDHRGDLYSVGVLLFKVLTGRLPFEDAATVAEILLAHTDREPPRFAAIAPGQRIMPAIELVVRGCLAKHPHERPQNARELGERFQAALGTRILLDDIAAEPIPPITPAKPRFNPLELVDTLEAWMPESIAVVKLRGFVADVNGEVVDSEPGLVRVRLPAPAPALPAPPKLSGWLGWLGIGNSTAARPLASLELYMEKQPGAGTHLHIHAVMRPEGRRGGKGSPEWQEWCRRICRELRACLISR